MVVALAGLRVIDETQVMAGRFCGMPTAAILTEPGYQESERRELRTRTIIQ